MRLITLRVIQMPQLTRRCAKCLRFPYRLRILNAIFLLVVLAVLVPGRVTAQEQAKPAAQAAASSDYVGSDTCTTCHADQGKHFSATVMGHAFAHPKTEKEKLGCEACHGPGKAHVEAGGTKETILRFTRDSKNSSEEKNSACLSCHTRGNRMFWQGSPHESRNMACVDCHVGHEPQTKKLSSDTRFNAPLSDVQTRKEQPELCLQCHLMRRAQLQRSSHMPYREGKVTCSSCHNPHGTPNP